MPEKKKSEEMTKPMKYEYGAWLKYQGFIRSFKKPKPPSKNEEKTVECHKVKESDMEKENETEKESSQDISQANYLTIRIYNIYPDEQDEENLNITSSKMWSNMYI